MSTQYQIIEFIVAGGVVNNALQSFTDSTLTLSIPYVTDNTDYQNFKAQINDESAPLYDADGVLMSPEAAKAYVATLP